MGHVLWPLLSQRSMQTRSYVWPVAIITGSCISSMLMGQKKEAGAVVVGCGASSAASALVDVASASKGSLRSAAMSGCELALPASCDPARRPAPCWPHDDCREREPALLRLC